MANSDAEAAPTPPQAPTYDSLEVIRTLRDRPELADRLTPEAKNDPTIANFIKVMQNPTYQRGVGAPPVIPPEPRTTRDPGFFQQHVVPAILPTLGAVGGALGGTAAAPFLGPAAPAGPFAGEALGSAAGEGLNQLMGITEPSAGQIALSAAAPGVGRVVGGVGREGLRYTAGRLAGAAPMLQQMGQATARALPAIIRPAADVVDQLYARVSAMGAPKVVVPELDKTVADLLANEQKLEATGTANTGLIKVLKGFQAMIHPPEGGGDQASLVAALRQQLGLKAGEPLPLDLSRMTIQGAERAPAGAQPIPFDVLRANLKRLGERIDSLRGGAPSGEGGDRGELLGAYKKLVSAIQTDFDSAQTWPIRTQAGEVVTALRQANTAAKREFAANDLADAIESKIMTSENRGFTQFSPGKVLDWIRKTEDGQRFAKAVTPQELAQITKTLQDLTRVPRLAPGAGQEFGSGRNIIRGAFGALAGEALGGHEGALVGTPLAIATSWAISRALMTEPGRQVLRRAVVEGGGFLEHRYLPALFTAAASQAAGPAGAVQLGSPLQTGARGAFRQDDPLGIR